MTITLVTPLSTLFEGEAVKVTVPALSGALTILPHHTNLIALLTHGEVIIDDEQSFAISEGFVNVANNHVNIIVSQASHTKDLDEEIIRSAIAAAKEYMQNQASDSPLKGSYSNLRKSISDLKILQKHKRKFQS